MHGRVLVPMDDSRLAERALTYALDHHPEAAITVLSVVGEPSVMMGEAASLAFEDDVEAAARERAEAVFDRARELADERGVQIDTTVAVGRPGRVIVDRADGYDAVVIGSHGGDLVDRLFVGNVTETVFRRSPVPVIVVR